GILSKQVTVAPGNGALGLPGTIGTVLLSKAATGEPELLLDGASFTAWRTAAAAALATAQLAPQNARRAVLFGCGTQAETQLIGLMSARPLEEILVIGRTEEAANRFIERCKAQHASLLEALTVPALRAGTFRPSWLRSADIVVTATTSPTPLFTLDDLSPGTHVAAIGGFRPGMIEFDPALACAADAFVESRTVAAEESGELIAAVEQGHCTPEDWTEFGTVLAGNHPGRRRDEDITLFKSVGHAAFDLFAARALADLPA
ncbi:MAG: ornithine cyclodeaminase family protein, partial [Pseudomonadota bacterium]